MSLTDAIAAKLQRVKQDWQENQRLDKAAHIAYEHTYHEEYAKERIKTAVAQAKKDAKAKAKPRATAGRPLGFNPAGFNQALEFSVLGEPAPTPKGRRKTRKKYSPKRHKKTTPKPKEPEYYNPFFDF